MTIKRSKTKRSDFFKIDTMRFFTLVLSLLLTCQFVAAQQQPDVKFGKNRVQFHQDYEEWLMYESRNFITYWYGQGRNIGQAAVQFAEYDFEEIQNILEHRLNHKIEIIVYSDITDLKQSNIGSEEAFQNTTGQTKIVGNKVFIHFDGNHNHLRRDIREGIATVYLNAMLFGSNLQEIVQNAVLLNLPDWFKQGLVSYIGEAWSTEKDNQLRDILLSEKYQQKEKFNTFKRMVEDYPELVGQSVWNYISQTYGHETVSNLLYLTRINRSIESGFLYVLGSSYEQTIENWLDSYSQEYKKEVAAMQPLEENKLVAIKNKHNAPLTQVKLSPNGQYVAYTINEIGKYQVYIQDLRSKERTLVKKGGFRNQFQATDYNYPLLAWNPSGFELAYMYEQRDVLFLSKYDTNTKETLTEEVDPQIQRVFSMDYVNNVDMVLSGVISGYTDLLYYRSNVRATQKITNDFWDDLDAVYVEVDNQKGILFASNRQDSIVQNAKLDTILPIHKFDIFYYDLENKSRELVRVTNTPLANERQPSRVDTTYFSFLTDETGIFNRKFGYLEEYIAYKERVVVLEDEQEILLHIDSTIQTLDSAVIAEIDTTFIRPVLKKRAINHFASNKSRNILTQHKAARADKMVELIYKDAKYQAQVFAVDPTVVVTPTLTAYKSKEVRMISFQSTQENANPETAISIEVNELEKADKEKEAAKQKAGSKEEGGYLFESGFEEPEQKEIATEKQKQDKQATAEEEPYLFQTQFDEPTNPRVGSPDEPRRATDKEGLVEENVVVEAKQKGKATQKSVHKFRTSRIVPYRLKFRTDYVTTTLDNSLLYEGLESPAANPDGFQTPVPGILLKTNFKDLFEDYEFELGARFPTTFNGDEYFVTFKNKKKRLDKTYTAYRKTRRFTPSNTSFPPEKRREVVLLGQAHFSYPLDIFTSLRGIASVRTDKIIELATDAQSLGQPTTTRQQAGLRLEYVYDNTLDVGINIKNGTRYKVFAEAIKRFDLDVFNGFNASAPKGMMGIIGFDARHYQRLLKHSVVALRAVGSTSFGSEKILYYVGGVNNWLFAKFDDGIPSPEPTGEEFVFQTLAYNLRGFKQNIRNGNSYGVFNAEVRVPIFRYFSRTTPRSSFLRNFQVVGFFDVGTAWQGLSPFKRDNPINTVTIERPNNPVSVKVNFFRDPIVAGYGAGVRTMLFGYFLRLDYAWGIETRVVQDPILYLSMGMDF